MMNISDKLTGQQVKEILMSIYEQSNKIENLQAKDLILEIKQKIHSVTQSTQQ